MTRLDLATEVVWIVGVVHQEFLRNVGEEAKVLVVCLRLSHPRHPLVLVVPPIMKAGGKQKKKRTLVRDGVTPEGWGGGGGYMVCESCEGAKREKERETERDTYTCGVVKLQLSPFSKSSRRTRKEVFGNVFALVGLHHLRGHMQSRSNTRAGRNIGRLLSATQLK